jgi:hypothetical protein
MVRTVRLGSGCQQEESVGEFHLRGVANEGTVCRWIEVKPGKTSRIHLGRMKDGVVLISTPGRTARATPCDHTPAALRAKEIS